MDDDMQLVWDYAIRRSEPGFETIVLRQAIFKIHGRVRLCLRALSRSFGESMNLSQVRLSKLNPRGANRVAHLFRFAGADDCGGHGRMMQSPRNSDCARGTIVTPPDDAQSLHQVEISRQFWLIEIGMVFAPIIVWHFGDALASHRPAQQAGGHRRIYDHPDSVLMAVR